MRFTIRDVAARVGVSPATVSNALNGKGGVSAAVKDQIFAVADELGYRPAREAGRPADHVRLIVYRAHGSIVNDNPFFMEMVEGMQAECRRDGVELTISHVHERLSDDFKAQLRDFREEKCAGFILLATEMTPEALAPFLDYKSPLVALDNSFPNQAVHSVSIDHRQAGALAARELVRAGHSTFGFITGSVPFRNAEERRLGFQAGLAEFGIPLTDGQIWPVSMLRSDTCDDMRRLIRARGKLPDAFFAANDGMAISCIRALVDEGYQVPWDVSVIGMDDTDISQVCTPQLTTLHVYRREMGIAAARLLLSLAGEVAAPPALKTAVGVSLVRRGTVRGMNGEDDA